MKKILIYLVIIIVFLSSQLFIENYILLLSSWISLGLLIAFFDLNFKGFLPAFLIQTLLGIGLFIYYPQGTADFMKMILAQLGYSSTFLLILVILFNALTAGFSILFASTIVGIVRHRKH